MKNITILFLLSLTSILSAQDCVDDPTGAYDAMGGCAAVLSWGFPCDQEFNGVIVSEECPVSCDTCPGECGNTDCEWDEAPDTCPEDCDTGCDLPDLNLYVTSSGSVLYNTSAAIGGFEFIVDGDGVVVTGAASGAGEEAGFTIVVNSETNKVLGFSFVGTTIPVGCGTLVEVEIEGTPTGLIGIVMSDAAGYALDFSYYSTGGVLGCMDDTACNYNADATEDDGSCWDADGTCDCYDNPVEDYCDCAGNLYDCADECGGAHWESDCGCVAADNSGYDCYDCAGVWYGDAVEDECGVCGGEGVAEACDCIDTSTLNADGCCDDVIMGCDYICGSGLVDDDCGICGGDGSDDLGCGCYLPGPSGCDNTCGSELVEDECGVCGGEGVAEACDCIDTSTLNADGCCDDVIMGCDYICGSGLVDDECGVCGGEGYDDYYCCTDGFGPNGEWPDCAGVCGGVTEYDICDVCNGSGPDVECWNGEYGCCDFDDDCGFPCSMDPIIQSKIHIDDHEIISGQYNYIPVDLFIYQPFEIEGMIFSVEISPITEGSPYIYDMDVSSGNYELNDEIYSNDNNPGYFSVIISGVDPPLIDNQNPAFINLEVFIPEEAGSNSLYELTIANASGTDPYYNDIIIVGDTAVLSGSNYYYPPQISGLEDQYLLEGGSTLLPFTTSDPEGTDVNVEIIDGPDWIGLYYDQDLEWGEISIDPPFGAEDWINVTVEVIDSDYNPNITYATFNIFINHYPYIENPETIDIADGVNFDEWISINDIDGDEIGNFEISAPLYMNYEFDEEDGQYNLHLSGTPPLGAESEYMNIAFQDYGNPEAWVSYDIYINVNLHPTISFDDTGMFDDEDMIHIPENDTLYVQAQLCDPDYDSGAYDGFGVNHDVTEFPTWVEWQGLEWDGGNCWFVTYEITPPEDADDHFLAIRFTDTDTLFIEKEIEINVYKTFLAGDVRPWGEDITGDDDIDDAGEFGNDNVLASDVINALKVTTLVVREEEMPDPGSNLFDAFDSSPNLDIDQNNDGDTYDEGERGGDGNILADDVMLSLKRATMVPEFPNVRRVDRDYPFSSRPEERENEDRGNPVDMLVLGHVSGMPGETVYIPVTLVRGESELFLAGLVSGFSLTYDDEDLELVESLDFMSDIESIEPFQVPTGYNYLSLLMMDMDEQAPNSDILIGHIAFEVPENAEEGDIFTFSTQGTSGSSANYISIIFNDGISGSVTVSTAVNQTVQTGVGWNWFSINVESDDMSVNNVLNALDATAGDFIKSQEASAEYYDEFGWFGSLENINIIDMYQLDIENGGTIAFTGYPADPSSAIIHLTDGWNWIGYIPQNAGVINDALGSIGDSGIFIKNQAASAEYYDEFGWFGSLDFMSGGDGYQLKISGEADLIYPNFESDDNLTRSMEVKEMPEAITEWAVNPHAYEFNGAITLSVENREDSPGDYIAAFVEGECRGIAERMDFPFDDVDRGIYILMAYSNMDKEEELTFKYFSDFEEEVIEYTESLEFTLDMVVGNGFKPFSLSREFIIPTEYNLSAAYPNPFNPVTTINYGIPEDSKVTIQVYSLQGRIVEVLTDQNMDAGYHVVTWNADNHASGMYFVKMHAGNYISTQKLMLVK